jgi:hypothetical protein
VLKTFFNLEQPEPVALDVPTAELEPYAGMYSRPMVDTELRVEDDKLMMQLTMKGGIPGVEIPPPPPPVALAVYGEDQMFVTEGAFKDARVEMLRDDNGAIAYLRLGLRINPRVKYFKEAYS